MIKVSKLLTHMLLIKFWLMTTIGTDRPLTTRVVQGEDSHNPSSKGVNNLDWTPGKISRPHSNSNKKNQIWHWIRSDRRKLKKEGSWRHWSLSRWKCVLAKLFWDRTKTKLTHHHRFSLRMPTEGPYLSKVKRRRRCSLKVAKSTSKFRLWRGWANLRVSIKLAVKWTSSL